MLEVSAIHACVHVHKGCIPYAHERVGGVPGYLFAMLIIMLFTVHDL